MSVRNRYRRQAEQGIIGWISNADAMLFGLLIVMMIAMLARAQLSRVVASEHDIRSKLGAAELTLGTLKSERDIALASVSEVQKRFSDLSPDVSNTPAEQKRLSDLVAKLEREIQDTAEAQKKEGLALAERLALAMKKANEQLDKILLLERLKSDNEARLAAEAVTVTQQTKTIALLNLNKSELTDQLSSAMKKLTLQADMISSLLRDKADSTARLEEEVNNITTYRKDIEQANYEITDLKKDVNSLRVQEKSIHKDLLGIRGPLKNVVFVVDASGSMKDKDNRWGFATEILDVWLQHLNVDRCALVVFSRSAKRFPVDGSYLELVGAKAEDNRKALIAHMKTITPEGGTNTFAGLRTAYSYQDLDTILLFTDGEPNNGNEIGFSKTEAKKIYDLVDSHRTTSINVLGMGHYFGEDMKGFIFRVIGNNGAFIGR